MKKILISRTDNLGDVLLTLPMVYMCKQLFPQSKISFLGKSYTRPLLELCPWIDHIELWDHWQGQDHSTLSQYVRAQEYDAVFHVFPRREIANLMQEAGVTLRIGTANRLFHWPLRCNKKLYFSRKNSDLHEAQLNLKLLSSWMRSIPSLAELNSLAPKLLKFPPVTELVSKYLNPSKPNFIIHPKSQGSAQEWGMQNFATLVNQLAEAGKHQLILTGTQKEGEELMQTLFTHLTDAAKKELINTCGQLKLAELTELISRSQKIIANSTGPLHIGALYGLKTFGLFPANNFRPMHAGRWSPLGTQVKILCPSDGKLLNTLRISIAEL